MIWRCFPNTCIQCAVPALLSRHCGSSGNKKEAVHSWYAHNYCKCALPSTKAGWLMPRVYNGTLKSFKPWVANVFSSINGLFCNCTLLDRLIVCKLNQSKKLSCRRGYFLAEIYVPTRIKEVLMLPDMSDCSTLLRAVIHPRLENLHSLPPQHLFFFVFCFFPSSFGLAFIFFLPVFSSLN